MSEQSLSDLIKEAAAEKGWSYREVARRSDLPPATVQKIITEHGIIPRHETLERLAYGLSLPVTKLLEATARDSGYTATRVDTDDISMIIAGIRELPEEKRAEIAALVRAMLGSR